MPGRQLGSYRVLEELGTGGMGTVYLAETPEGERRALKVVHPHLLATPETRARFRREAEIGQRVRHAAVVRTLGAETHGDASLLVMEYVRGQTLRALLGELGRVPEELCRHIGREVAGALAAIHDAGAVHRDIKPENILITDAHAVKVMDLSVARLVDEAVRLSQTGAFVGSVLYAAPEQFGTGWGVDARADLYALGLVLYELATGRHPFGRDDLAQLIQRRLAEDARPAAELNPQLSPFFEEVLRALLARKPDDRVATAAELRAIFKGGERSGWWQARAHALRAATRRPLRRIRVPRETALYGRDGELEKLAALFARVSDAQARILLIEGEAGIGKSRLVDEFAARLGEEANFLFGSYAPGGAATATGAFTTAYHEHFGDEGCAHYLRETPALVPAFDALLKGEPPPTGQPPLTKDSLQTVFLHATRALAAERPTVLLIEDLHFAPEEGRALLAALATALAEDRVLVIGTMRPGVPEDWLAAVERLPHAERLSLPRLGPKDLTRLLVDAFASQRLAEELAYKIAQKSDGNPFFVFEIIRGLRDGQFLRRRPDGAWETTKVIEELEIPSSVLELIEARIADLALEDKNLLDVAACLGFEFDPLLAADVLGLARIPMLQRLARLEKTHRLVRSAGRRFVFDHHQVQEALYAGLPELLREEYHGALGAALEARGGGAPAELCGHFFSGGQPQRAVQYLDAALDRLEANHLNAAAAALADRALAAEGLLTGERRIRVLLRLAERQDLLGRLDAESTTLEEARALADHASLELRARVFLMTGWLRVHVARFDEAEEILRQAVDLAREAGNKLLEAESHSNLATVFHARGRYEKATPYFERSIALAREADDRQQVAAYTGNLGTVYFFQGLNEEARKCFEESLAVAREVGARRTEQNALVNLGGVHWRAGRNAEAQEAYDQATALAHEAGDRRTEAMIVGNAAHIQTSLGRPGEALAGFERSLALAHEMGARLTEANARQNVAETLVTLGDLARARACAADCLAFGKETDNRELEGHALHTLAKVAEDPAEAERLYRACLAIWREAKSHAEIVGALLALGRLLGDEKVLKEALDRAERLGDDGLALVAAALLGRSGEEPPETLDHFVRMEIRFVSWKATRDPEQLRAAHSLLEEARSHAPTRYRDTMIENVTLHREIAAAWRNHGG